MSIQFKRNARWWESLLWWRSKRVLSIYIWEEGWEVHTDKKMLHLLLSKIGPLRLNEKLCWLIADTILREIAEHGDRNAPGKTAHQADLLSFPPGRDPRAN